jgi:hypothetical protein
MDLQGSLEYKTEEMAKEAAKAGKKTFAFVAEAEAAIIKGAFNIAAFIPKNIISGISENVSDKEYRGKQTIKRLVGSGAKLEDIPISKENIGSFESTARKYGIDYSLKKAENDGKTQYIVFYKAKDVNVLNVAFKEFTAKVIKREGKQSIKERLREERTAERAQNRERSREKKKDRESVL